MPDSVALTRPRALWRSFGTAAWLGWQIESNWTSIWVFALYTVVKPLAAAGILVVMYAMVNRARFDSPMFTYMYVGNAFYMFVGAVMSGMGWVIVQDREHYRTLKSVYAAPLDVRLYLIGRGLTKFVTASFSVFLTLSLGIAFLGVPVSPSAINWPLFVAALALGVTMLAFMGLMMASVMLLSGQSAWAIGELLAGALYLFSGALFPLDVLPAALRYVGLALPVTYWLELVRRTLVTSAASLPAATAWSDQRLLGTLVVLTAMLGVISIVVFDMCEGRARERGLLDRTSNY